MVSSPLHRLPGSPLVSSDLSHLGTHALRGYYTHRAIEFPSFDPSLPCISYLRLLLPLTLSPLAGHFLPSFLGGWLSPDVPFHGCIYSCWGCFEEDQIRWVFLSWRFLVFYASMVRPLVLSVTPLLFLLQVTDVLMSVGVIAGVILQVGLAPASLRCCRSKRQKQ